MLLHPSRIKPLPSSSSSRLNLSKVEHLNSSRNNNSNKLVVSLSRQASLPLLMPRANSPLPRLATLKLVVPQLPIQGRWQTCLPVQI